MQNKNIGVIRGVFDPPHKGHLNSIISSVETLTLSKIYVIIKFIGEKDPITSVEERIRMMQLQLEDYNLPVEVLRQNIKGHTQELLDLRQKSTGNIINICGSDKSAREIEIYGNQGDTFGIIKRPDFNTDIETSLASKVMGINLVNISGLPISSTSIKNAFKNNVFFQNEIHIKVINYIKNNGLYLQNNDLYEKFILGWFLFLDKLVSIFPQLNLLDIAIPLFNPVQSKNAWREKYIRTIVKTLKIRGDDLVKFVLESEKIEI